MSTQVKTLINSYNTLLFAQNHLSFSVFKNIFEDLAEHLWKKWEYSERNILYFMTRIDSTNLEKLLSWAIEEEKRS